jgi:hypothetical protein
MTGIFLQGTIVTRSPDLIKGHMLFPSTLIAHDPVLEIASRNAALCSGCTATPGTKGDAGNLIGRAPEMEVVRRYAPGDPFGDA